MKKKITIDELNKISYKIIGSAIDVHRKLGPGLLESTYEVINKGLKVERQKPYL